MNQIRPELPEPPPRIAKLPVDARGYPVPWFVAWVADDGVTPASPEEGTPDFRVIAPGRIDEAVRFNRCWLCGQTLGANVAYVIGPMCAVNRISAEPPSHRDCALYAAVACPFLTRPHMERNEHGPVPAGATEEPPGLALKRNPGLALVWVTKGVHRAPRRAVQRRAPDRGVLGRRRPHGDQGGGRSVDRFRLAGARGGRGAAGPARAKAARPDGRRRSGAVPARGRVGASARAGILLRHALLEPAAACASCRMVVPRRASRDAPAVTSVAVLIPVLGRPDRVAPLVESVAAASRFVRCYPVFLVSPGDEAELEAIEAIRVFDDEGDDNLFYLVVDWEPGAGDYARKMNRGFAWVRDSFEFVFLAADDLYFHPGWIERALATHLETGACVVGTNDLGNRSVIAGEHSTHTLVSRSYVECGAIDDPSRLLHEGYDHNFVDAEFIATAMARETFAHATDSRVEHLHPNWGKGVMDATYRKGLARFQEDRALFDQRRRLWT